MEHNGKGGDVDDGGNVVVVLTAVVDVVVVGVVGVVENHSVDVLVLVMSKQSGYNGPYPVIH